MFKEFWNALTGAAAEPENNGAGNVHLKRQRMLLEHFPIGRKLRYYPEYQRDIVFNTLIVAYCVDHEYLYSRDAIETDADGVPVAFMVGEGRRRVPLDKVSKLSLLVPDTSDMERTLDYFRRAEIGRGGQFSRGNAITLMVDSSQRGIPTVDTQVQKRLRMESGPYVDSRMILLEPELNTLSVKDQRRRERVHTEVPVELYTAEDTPPVRCILGDFSELSVRLQTSAGGETMPPLHPDDVVTIAFSLGDPPKTYTIRGTVLRRSPHDCVLKLQKLLKDGDFMNFKVMDMLEIKTGLLNYGG